MDIEQSTLIWVTRLIFAAILGVLAYSIWRFMRRERFISIPERAPYTPPQNIELPEKNLTLSVMAKPGRYFNTQELFSALNEVGFIYGENNIFEYFVPNTNYIAFSAINIRAPHTFTASPEDMPQTNGLITIMQLPVADGDNQVDYFHLLLSVLDDLCIRLDAELCTSKRSPLKNQILYDMQKDIEMFEHNYNNKIQHDYNRTDA